MGSLQGVYADRHSEAFQQRAGSYIDVDIVALSSFNPQLLEQGILQSDLAVWRHALARDSNAPVQQQPFAEMIWSSLTMMTFSPDPPDGFGSFWMDSNCLYYVGLVMLVVRDSVGK